MSKFLSVALSLLFLGLFVIGIFNFQDKLAEANGGKYSYKDNTTIGQSINSINGNLSTYLDTSTASQTAISNSTVLNSNGAGQNLVVEASAGIWQSLIATPITIYQLTIGLAKTYLFGDSEFGVILDVLAGMLVLVVIISVIAFLVSGQGD